MLMLILSAGSVALLVHAAFTVYTVSELPDCLQASRAVREYSCRKVV